MRLCSALSPPLSLSPPVFFSSVTLRFRVCFLYPKRLLPVRSLGFFQLFLFSIAFPFVCPSAPFIKADFPLLQRDGVPPSLLGFCFFYPPGPFGNDGTGWSFLAGCVFPPPAVNYRRASFFFRDPFFRDALLFRLFFDFLYWRYFPSTFWGNECAFAIFLLLMFAISFPPDHAIFFRCLLLLRKWCHLGGSEFSPLDYE